MIPNSGRQIELVTVGFDPTSTTPGEAECVQLTEDEDVSPVTGLFLDEAVLCPLEAHATAVIGGSMTAERIERAQQGANRALLVRQGSWTGRSTGCRLGRRRRAG